MELVNSKNFAVFSIRFAGPHPCKEVLGLSELQLDLYLECECTMEHNNNVNVT